MSGYADALEFFVARQTPMLRVVGSSFGEAIDLFIGDLARQGKSLSTRRSYERQLNHFARQVRDKPPAELDLADYETFRYYPLHTRRQRRRALA